jgi:hypothetical protein
MNLVCSTGSNVHICRYGWPHVGAPSILLIKIHRWGFYLGIPQSCWQPKETMLFLQPKSTSSNILYSKLSLNITYLKCSCTYERFIIFWVYGTRSIVHNASHFHQETDLTLRAMLFFIWSSKVHNVQLPTTYLAKNQERIHKAWNIVSLSCLSSLQKLGGD